MNKLVISLILGFMLSGCSLLFQQNPNSGDYKQASTPPTISINQHVWVDNWKDATGTVFYDPYTVVNNHDGTYLVWTKWTKVPTVVTDRYPTATAELLHWKLMCGTSSKVMLEAYAYDKNGSFVFGLTSNHIQVVGADDAVYNEVCSKSPIAVKVSHNARLEYIAAHQEESANIRQSILDGKIETGMTKADVVASWGQPCSYCYGTTHNSWGDSWEYNIEGSAAPGAGTYVYFDDNGLVTGWSGQ